MKKITMIFNSPINRLSLISRKFKEKKASFWWRSSEKD